MLDGGSVGQESEEGLFVKDKSRKVRRYDMGVHPPPMVVKGHICTNIWESTENGRGQNEKGER